ncbi:uncharacterized protein SAPINGB_P002946 [Magnusiomyces paraingens]|uniref:14-3-3 domain-containing protein n=1 Tax=Magnusiomyces paraingens TaxID=2606893 RepID=A0A5E8BH38_9ASCO|nr:uncharacterized protein SAPINGB_P002946 [Saprochaete ingens]VVT50986.1 unnamed protein product [Saprochaete ingens]
MATTRKNLVLLAKTAEEAERYKDAAKIMKAIVHTGKELDDEEQTLLYDIYRHLAHNLKVSLKNLSPLVQEETDKHNSKHLHLVQKQISQIKKELINTCCDIIEILEEDLIPTTTSNKNKVIYYKMKGDYYNYLINLYSGPQHDEIVQEALEAYVFAFNIANKNLSPTDPTRLGVAINFSVFYHEVIKSTKKSCEIAQQAFNSAFEALDTLTEDNNQKTIASMEILRDNISIFSSEKSKD